MPLYRLVYQQQGTTEQIALTLKARRPCSARTEGRNNLNARSLDPVQWPLLSLVEST
jgi:hypothetical protein